MAPKRKGHVAYGKARVFHHAVETVHVGLGHAVLGSLSLQLAAGPPQRPRRASNNTSAAVLSESVALPDKSVLTDEQAAMPAFGLELDALMQSHSAKDFKRFRWEVKEWCATRALFQLHHRLIAEKLLRALLERNAGRYSSKSKHRVKAVASEADESESDSDDEEEEEGTRRKKDDKSVDSTRGLTSEGFEAFARLTIAFARDLQADFLPYYEVFQRALQAGLYDRQGQLLADATRVQLIYAVQAAWCREMMWYWPQKEHRVLVQRIVRLYVVQLSDRKDYLRRLTAELLGYLCRLAHSLLPLVVSTAAEQLLEAYEHFCTATITSTTAEEDNANDENEEGEEEVDDEQSSHAAKEHTVTTDSAVMADPTLWATFIQRELRTSTLLDGLASLCAEMLRGMRGALNSAVDLHYRLLLRSFLLCEPNYCQDDEAAEKEDEEEEANSAQQQRVNDKRTVETMPEGAKEQLSQSNNDDVPSNTTTFSARWGNVFATTPVQVTEGHTMQHSQPHCDVMTCVAQEIVRAAGRMALEMALIQVLHETHKATSASLVALSEDANNNETDNNKSVDALDMRRPAHRLLSIVVHALLALPDSTTTPLLARYDHHHLRLLTAVLMAEDGLLLRDAAIVPTMRDVSRQLRRSLSQMSQRNHNIHINESSNTEYEATTRQYVFAQALDIQYVAALLELIMPFCLSPMLETNTTVTTTHLVHNNASVKQDAGKPHALLLQEVLLPVGKQCIALALQWSAVQSRSSVNALAGMTRCCLWAFVQDVLQKSYAYALQEDDGKGGADNMDGVASVEDDDEEDELANSKATHANGHYTVTDQTVGVKRASRMGTRSAVTAAVQTRSALTPLGLTLLHRVFVVYCRRATEQLLLTKHNTQNSAAKAYDETVTAGLPQDLTQTILMLRAAAESTPRQSCSPLQQLMRLRLARPSKATQQSHQLTAQTSAGAELQGALEHLLLSLITTLTTARTEANGKVYYASHALAELLACAWPVVQALLQVVHTGTNLAEVASSQRLDKMQDALLALMHTVDADVHGNTKSAQAADTLVMGEESGALAAEALSYTLYVQIAALLMRLSDRTKVVQSAHSSNIPEQGSTRVQGMRYLVESIAMLGRGFDSLRRASTTTTTKTTTMDSDEAADDVLMDGKSTVGLDVENALRMDSHDASQHLQLSVTVGSVEAARRRLFAGAEVLLDSLAWALHYNGQLNITDSAVKERVAEDEQVEGEAIKPALQRSGPSRRTREALELLKPTLCVAHSERVAWQLREILFECLTAAQPARVRLRALELLALLTHPSLKYTSNNVTHNGTRNAEEDDNSGSNNNKATNGTLYLPGLCEVDPHVMQSLLRAERYNPLAERSGHVDGLRQALTPLLFRCESGQMSATGEAMSLTRAIVGRAMIGLFYRKYAPAWPMAIKILAALAHTSHTKHAHNNNNNNNSNVQEVDVWRDVICRYGPLLVLGGQSQPARKQLRPTRRTFTSDTTNEGEVGQPLALCFYDIRFTLQEQRAATQEQGSLAHNLALAQATSNNNSSTASSSSSSPLLSILAAASEGVSGNTSLSHAVVPLLHWQSQSMNNNADVAITGNESSTMLYRTGAQASTSSAAAVRKESERWHTDSATVACSFLAMLAEVMQGCSNSSSKETRRKIALVRQLVLALSALHRNTQSAQDTHTYSTTTTTNTTMSSLVQSVGTVRRLEDRLVAAMQALAQAPYIPVRHSSSSLHNHTRVSEKTTCERNEEEEEVDEAKVMQGLFLSYLTEGQQGNVTSTAKLQRAALDNLKRLKVRPFATYYAQLVPFTDTVKALFGFLSTFHIDTDIPTHDRADYLAAALTIALPKLLAKGSKDKLKQQALLRRRLMSLVAQLPDDTSGRAIAEVLQKLVHRLVFTSAGSTSKDASTSEEKTIHKQLSEEVQDVSMYDFLSQWQRMIAQSYMKQTSTNDADNNSKDAPTYYVPQPLLRRVERLAKRLTSAMELLEAVLHAIGTRFASYVPACLHLSCQAYLFACTHLLRESALSAVQQESNAANVTPSLVILNIPTHTATALAALRRASLTVVQMLFAQLPSEVMNTIRQNITHVQQGNASEDEENVLSSSLLGRYLHALQLNTRGTQRNAQAAWQDGRAGAAQYAKATPTLRLVTSWVKAPVLHPLLPAYSDFTLETLTSLLTLSDGSNNNTSISNTLGAAVLKAAAGVLYEAMRDVTDILDAADEPMQPLITSTTLTTEKKQKKKKGIRAKKGKKAVSTTTSDEGVNEETMGNKATPVCTTLREAFVRPYITRLFAALYRLVVRGAGEGSEGKRASRSSVFSFSVAMWEEIMKTVSLLASQLSNDIMTGKETSLVPSTGVNTNSDGPNEVVTMLGRLLEIVLRFVTHPICATQSTSVTMATAVVQRITAQLPIVDLQRHFRPLVHLFNVVTNPQARLTLCETVGDMMDKLPIALRTENMNKEGEWVRVEANEGTSEDVTTTTKTKKQQRKGEAKTRSTTNTAQDDGASNAWSAQLQAVGRAVHCLNSFAEDNTSLEQYDYELRYHTFHSLLEFFIHDGNYGATTTSNKKNEASSRTRDAVRQEREYSGAQDVRIPLHSSSNSNRHIPVLALEAFALLMTNVLFFLRDTQSTIRALAAQLLEAMIGYAARQPYAHSLLIVPHQNNTQNEEDTNEKSMTYKTAVLHDVIRAEVLPSLRRGVVARDTLIRYTHMSAFNALAKYYSADFASFALLFARNSEQNFFSLVGHVQPRCRLHALALLRQAVPTMQIRDLLRVFVPFLMTAVKDYAQGKWTLPNTSEGRARGYCDAVLQTIATIASALPWQAYYHVLSLLLLNAREQPALRVVMLRGVVQVLHAFHFLNNKDEEMNKNEEEGKKESEASADDDDSSSEEEEEEEKAWRAKRAQYRQHHILYVLEQDILPQLFDYVSESKQARKALGMTTTNTADLRNSGNPHTAEKIRSEQAKADAAQSRHTLLQLPVAVAITKIIARFPEEALDRYLDHLIDAVVLKLRNKQHDKQRDRARRMLAAILHEVGPRKLERVLVKLRDNLVHGYQLHVLGYTVVTLLYQLYEPHSALARQGGGAITGITRKATSISASVSKRRSASAQAETKDDDEGTEQKRQRRRLEFSTNTTTSNTKRNAEDKEEDEDEREEAELMRQLRPTTTSTSAAGQHVSFDYEEGVACLTGLLPSLMQLLLDSYLGEVGLQKEQVELMSMMVEVKTNRALQGFTLLARHCAADKVLETFLHQITWLLTPPTLPANSTESDVSTLHGSARARALIVQALQQKYTTLSKGAQADLPFVDKVRGLAVRVARSLTVNPTLHLEHALSQIRDLLARHNAVREAKIAAFEAKDGTRRIRGNAHIVLHRVERLTRKEQLDKQLLIAREPERVDVDFSAHTVLATQNKQKLRVYRGRYGTRVQDAAKDFYREDPSTAIVLDTLDEFLLRCLLSTLKKVLGIGRQKGSSAAAVQLDLLRQRRLRRTQAVDKKEDDEEEDTKAQDTDANENEEEEDEKDHSSDSDEDELEPRTLQEESDEDALDRFVSAQEGGQQEEDEHTSEGNTATITTRRRRGRTATTQRSLAVQFTQTHRPLLESLVPVILLTLRGEGADAVVAEALDCLLALVALQPPLAAVEEVSAGLFESVTSYFGRGGAIKQRAMRVCAGLIAHQKFTLSPEQASQLVLLARAEIIERSEFLPMALRLLYAILGKHIHVVEVYAIVDIITELLVHLAGKAVVRQRCLHILVRFLTEYKLTREKFRSHIELLLRNLDFPELAGRLALLELLDQLVRRLPTVILRDEAPLLLVPLAAARTGAEWAEVREKAATVLSSLVCGAGLDVLTPLLAAWLQERQPRAQRNVGLQVWATLLPAVIGMYDLTANTTTTTNEEDEERAALLASVSWSVPSVLAGCLYVPPAPKKKKKSHTSPDNNNSGSTAQHSAQAQARRGWTVVFYGLRCAESMLTALPEDLYPMMGPQLLPFCLQKGILHPHPWVQAVSLRLVRHYCYNYVEFRAHFLRHSYTDIYTSSITKNGGSNVVEGDSSDVLPFLGLTHWQENNNITKTSSVGRKAVRVFCEAGKQTFLALIGALKTVLQRVSMTDVSSEKYMALRALRDPSRTQSLKLMFYLSKAITHVALSLLHAVTTTTTLTKQEVIKSSGMKDAMHTWLRKEYALLHHQLHALIAPTLKQQSVVNYLVRSTTLVQFFGAYISVLPTVHDEANSTQPNNTVNDDGDMLEEKRWLLQADGMNVPALLRETIWPLLKLALHAGVLSRKLAMLSYQSATVLQGQLTERQTLLTTTANTTTPTTTKQVTSGKRKRARDGEYNGEGTAEELKPHTSGVEDIVREMTGVLAELQSERRTKQIRRETHKAMKRSRQEMSSARISK